MMTKTVNQVKPALIAIPQVQARIMAAIAQVSLVTNLLNQKKNQRNQLTSQCNSFLYNFDKRTNRELKE